MKIVHLSHLASPDAPTGAERSLALLAEGLAARGHEIRVAAPRRWLLADGLANHGVTVETIPTRCLWLVHHERQPMPIQAMRVLRFLVPDPGAARLRSWLDEIGPDVVHVNCLPHVRGAAVARECGCPVVWHVREILCAGRRRRWFARRLSVHADRIVAVSRAVAEWLAEEGLGDRVSVIHNGVDPPGQVPPASVTKAGIGVEPSAPTIGFFGQLIPHKGVIDFIHAAHEVVRSIPAAEFLVVGMGRRSYHETLERETGAGPAAGRIHLLPPRQEIWSFLAATDVVVVPSLSPDPLPRVVLESMVMGVPVVAYRNGGVPEMVIDGETGILCVPGDRSSLARGIARLAAADEERRRLGSAARERAMAHFSVARHVERMEAVLRSVVTSNL